MNKRFIKIFESTISRYTNGGFLVGDIVKIKPDAIRHKSFESNEEMKFQLKDLMSSDLNLRIVNIKNKYPNVMGGSNTDTIGRQEALVDIAQELAPGRYHKYITVPMDVLVEINPNVPNLAPIPDSVKRKGNIQIKPGVPEKAEEDNEFSPGNQTQKSVVEPHGKNVKGDRELPTSNTQIPSSPAVGQRDPVSYTAEYLPKEKKR